MVEAPKQEGTGIKPTSHRQGGQDKAMGLLLYLRALDRQEERIILKLWPSGRGEKNYLDRPR